MFKAFMRHKVITFLVLAALVVGGYYGYRKMTAVPAETKYVLSAVTRGTIVVNVDGTGQVAVSDQVDVKPKVSGDVTSVPVVEGQVVKAGDVIVKLDRTDALKAVRDAQANLDSAKLALDKLKQPPDQLSVTQAQNALSQATENKKNTQDDLAKSYDDGFSGISNAFIDLPNVMTGLYDTLYGNDSSKNTGQANLDYYADTVRIYDESVVQYRDDANTAYLKARDLYDANFADYKAASRFSDKATIETLISETYDTAKSVAEAVKNASNLIQFYEDRLTERGLTPVTTADTYLSSLSSYTGKVNTHLVNLLNVKQTIQNDKNAIVAADRTITEKTQSLAQLLAGADPLDVKSQELNIVQRQNALQDAKDQLSYYTVTAPFGGVIAAVNVKPGDPASSGTALVTLIAKQSIAEISLNEVDAAKIKIGQKSTLTFDAVPGLSITGDVSQIDTLGTVTQGVVTYGIQIGFDTQDSRVKPGMSLSAAVITDSKTDVTMVPNSAVKTTNDGQSYVEMLDNPVPVAAATSNNASTQTVTSATSPRRQLVQTGLVNDSMTEIVSGLSETERVITSTIKPTTGSTTTNRSIFQQIQGGGGRPGGAAPTTVRTQGMIIRD